MHRIARLLRADGYNFTVVNSSNLSDVAERVPMLMRGIGASSIPRSYPAHDVIRNGELNAFAAALPSSAYLVAPDVDEFFQYPCNVADAMRSVNALCSYWFDRLPASELLQPIHPDVPIWQQYPICVHIRGSLPHTGLVYGYNHKLTLLRTRINGTLVQIRNQHQAFLPRRGHSQPIELGGKYLANCASNGVAINHFSMTPGAAALARYKLRMSSKSRSST